MVNQRLYAFPSEAMHNKRLTMKHKKSKGCNAVLVPRVSPHAYSWEGWEHHGKVTQWQRCGEEVEWVQQGMIWWRICAVNVFFYACVQIGVQKVARTGGRCGNGVYRKGNWSVRCLREIKAQVVVFLLPRCRRASSWSYMGTQGWPLCVWMVVETHILSSVNDDFLKTQARTSHKRKEEKTKRRIRNTCSL